MPSDTPDLPKTHAPVLPLRDVVVYPHMVIPLFVGREKSINALEAAMEDDKHILLVAQKSAEVDEPGADDLYNHGTVASILQMLKLPDGTVKVLVEGLERATVVGSEHRRSVFHRPPEAGRTARLFRRSRDRGPEPFDHEHVRPVRETEQEDSAGDPFLPGRDRRAGPAGRHHCRPHVPENRGKAAHPRDLRVRGSGSSI